MRSSKTYLTANEEVRIHNELRKHMLRHIPCPRCAATSPSEPPPMRTIFGFNALKCGPATFELLCTSCCTKIDIKLTLTDEDLEDVLEKDQYKAYLEYKKRPELFGSNAIGHWKLPEQLKK